MDFVSCNYLLPHVCYVISFMFSDPQVQKSFVDALYAGGPFLQSLPNALAPDGFLLAQVGEASGIPEWLLRAFRRSGIISFGTLLRRF